MGKKTIEVPSTDEVDVGTCDNCGREAENGIAYYPVPLATVLSDDEEPGEFFDDDSRIDLCQGCAEDGEIPVRDISVKQHDPAQERVGEWFDLLVTIAVATGLGGILFMVLILVTP